MLWGAWWRIWLEIAYKFACLRAGYLRLIRGPERIAKTSVNTLQSGIRLAALFGSLRPRSPFFRFASFVCGLFFEHKFVT